MSRSVEMLRELGQRTRVPVTLCVGESIALMLDDLITRSTEDVDVVDELPAEVRQDHALIDELAARYGLRLTHFQSHYLPDGWRQRVHSLGRFGSITAFRVDPLDVLVGKLFSSRTKDLDDLRIAMPKLDRAAFVERLMRTTARWHTDDRLRVAAERNWYILSGQQSLPAAH